MSPERTAEGVLGWLPRAVEELIDSALVTELTVVRGDGRPITYPLIPLLVDGRLLMTSSILFSRKLEHIKDNPRVALSFSDPIAMNGNPMRATLQGDARVLDGDPHSDWEPLLDRWSVKEPAILQFYKARVAFPLFFERSVIEVTPRRLLLWPDGDTSRPPQVLTPDSAAPAEAAA